MPPAKTSFFLLLGMLLFGVLFFLPGLDEEPPRGLTNDSIAFPETDKANDNFENGVFPRVLAQSNTSENHSRCQIKIVEGDGSPAPFGVIYVFGSEKELVEFKADGKGILWISGRISSKAMVVARNETPNKLAVRSEVKTIIFGETEVAILTLDKSSAVIFGGLIGADSNTIYSSFVIGVSGDSSAPPQIPDNNGAFLFPDVPPGEQISVDCFQNRKRLQFRPISLEPGEIVVAHFRPGSSLTVKVKLPAEGTQSQLVAYLRPLSWENGECLLKSKVVSDQAEFPFVPMGEYTLTLREGLQPPGGPYQFAPVFRYVSMGPMPITVELELFKAPTIALTISDGSPFCNDTIEYWFELGSNISTRDYRRKMSFVNDPNAPAELFPPLGASRLVVRSARFGGAETSLFLGQGEFQHINLILQKFPTVRLDTFPPKATSGWLWIQDENNRIVASRKFDLARLNVGTLDFGEGPIELAESPDSLLEIGKVAPGWYRVAIYSNGRCTWSISKYVQQDTTFELIPLEKHITE